MSTSGSYTHTRNRDQIIGDALRKIGAIASGETPDSQTVDEAAAALNGMIRHWQGQGLHIWTMAEATLFLQAAQIQYTLSSTSTDHCTESFVQTTLSADKATSSTILPLTTTSGMTAADYIGIQVDDGSFHWTTIVSVDSSTQVTITTGIDDSASSGAIVVTYTTKIVRPLRISYARRYNLSSGIETPIDVEERKEYFDIPNKTNSGYPNVVFYDRRGGANASGLLHVWQPQSAPTQALKFTWARPIQAFTASANDPDFPDEWVQALTFNLAAVLAPEYDVPLQKMAGIQGMADRYLKEVSWNEDELEAIEFTLRKRR